MTEQTYTTVDKSDWGDGPWQHEPDKVVWVDEATGLDAMVVRGPAGAWCGYVGVPASHPLHGKGYYDDEGGGPDVNVHGGLTYANGCDDEAPPEKAICHIPGPGRPDDVWWFGFDCYHYQDYAPGAEARLRRVSSSYAPPDHACFRWEGQGGELVYRTLDYVRGEVTSLAAQLAAVR